MIHWYPNIIGISVFSGHNTLPVLIILELLGQDSLPA